MFKEVMPNNDIYVSRMEKSILDKALFMSHVDADIIIDFGCANGALIKFLSQIFPNKYYIGYDISNVMINKAKKNFGEDYESLRIKFTTKWDDVMEYINKLKDADSRLKTCFVCSSVIHEVYAYGTEKEIDLFWDRFWNSGFDYIAVRDMYRNYSSSYNWFYPKYVKELIRQSQYGHHYDQFIERWGHMNTLNRFHHFFLKYFYTENWNRELNEDYLPEDKRLHHMVDSSDFDVYETIFDIKYILPYIKERVKNDFGLEIYRPTHYQKILKLQKP